MPNKLAGSILFFPDSSGVGLGHISRSANIAQEIQAIRPEADIRFLLHPVAADIHLVKGYGVERLGVDRIRRQQTPATFVSRLLQPRWNWLLARAANSRKFRAGVRSLGGRSAEIKVRGLLASLGDTNDVEYTFISSIAALAPQTLIVDIHWNNWAPYVRDRVGRLCVIYREEAGELAAGREKLMRCADCIIVPHESELPFSQAVTSAYGEKVHCVGEVFRTASPDGVEEMKRGLGLTDGDPVVSFLFGGGGAKSSDTPETFSPRANLDLAMRLAAKHKSFKFVFVAGPYSSLVPAEADLGLENLIVRQSIDNAPALIGASELVVANAGYNTVNEIRGCATPSVLIPRQTQAGEQELRASRMETLGISRVSHTPAAAEAVIDSLLHNTKALHELRCSAQARRIKSGAAEAAKAILEF